jgi:hypothetical protein
MSRSKKDKENVNETENNSVPAENGGPEKQDGGDISSVKFNSIFLALGICIALMVIAKLLGL